MTIESDYYENYGMVDPRDYIRSRFIESPREIERFYKVIEALPQNINNLLDVGCGNGLFLELLRQKKSSLSSTGIERSETTLNAAKELFNLNLMLGRAEELPFKDKSFDVVTAMEVIEHLLCSSYNKALEELERVAKKNIILTVPYQEIRIFVTCPSCQCKFSPIFHLRTFNELSLHQLFKDFKLIKKEVIYGHHPSGKNLIVRLKNLLNLHPFGEFSICPACGYCDLNSTKDSAKSPVQKTSFIKKIYRTALPKI